MLQSLMHVNHPLFDFPVFKLSGRKLARGGYSKSPRAALAASVVYGEIEMIKPTLRQLAKAFNVSTTYIQKALALSPAERVKMRYGYTKIANIPPSAAELKRAIKRAGIEPTWEAICNQL
jgi:hypothetical protein